MSQRVRGANGRHRPRVLIVEPNPVLSMEVLTECLALGLEPRLCRGLGHSMECPGLRGRDCSLSEEVSAVLIAVTDMRDKLAAPACAGRARVLLCCGAHARDVQGAGSVAADRYLDYPYDPLEAANILFSLTSEEVRDKDLGSDPKGRALLSF